MLPMMALIHSAPKRQPDALDIEFDAVYEVVREKSGEPHHGLFLVTAENIASLQAAPEKPPAPSLFVRMGDAVYDAVDRMMGWRPSRA